MSSFFDNIQIESVPESGSEGSDDETFSISSAFGIPQTSKKATKKKTMKSNVRGRGGYRGRGRGNKGPNPIARKNVFEVEENEENEEEKDQITQTKNVNDNQQMSSIEKQPEMKDVKEVKEIKETIEIKPEIKETVEIKDTVEMKPEIKEDKEDNEVKETTEIKEINIPIVHQQIDEKEQQNNQQKQTLVIEMDNENEKEKEEKEKEEQQEQQEEYPIRRGKNAKMKRNVMRRGARKTSTMASRNREENEEDNDNTLTSNVNTRAKNMKLNIQITEANTTENDNNDNDNNNDNNEETTESMSLTSTTTATEDVDGSVHRVKPRKKATLAKHNRRAKQAKTKLTDSEMFSQYSRSQLNIRESTLLSNQPEDPQQQQTNQPQQPMVDPFGNEEENDEDSEDVSSKKKKYNKYKLNKRLSVFSSNFIIRKKFGNGISSYFDFLYYMIVSDFIIGLFLLFSWTIQIMDADYSANPFNLIYIQYYGGGTRSFVLFEVTNILLFVFSFLQSILYFWTRRHIVNEEEEMMKLRKEIDEDVAKQYYMPIDRDTEGELLEKSDASTSQQIQKNIASFVIYFICVIFACVLVAFLQLDVSGAFAALSEKTDEALKGTFVAGVNFGSIFTSLGICIINQFIRIVSNYLSNHYEIHKQYNKFVMTTVIKDLAGKFFIIETMYICDKLNMNSQDCALQQSGITFLTFVFVDVFCLVIISSFTVLSEWLSDRFKIKCKYRLFNACKGMFAKLCSYKCCTSEYIEEKDFDLDGEFYEIFFKQFNFIVGSIYCPPLMIFGSLTFAIKYVFDKLTLTKVSYNSKKTTQDSIVFSAKILVIVDFLALILPFYGGMWILSGDFFQSFNKDFCGCKVFVDDDGNNYLKGCQ